MPSKPPLTEEQLERHRAQQRKYRAKDTERARAYARQWYRDHKEKCYQWSKQKFALNPEKHRAIVRKNYLDRAFGPGGAAYYEKTLAEQQGRCAICGELARPVKYGRLHQDHDTACCPYDRSKSIKRRGVMLRTCGKCRRGLLCNSCNTALSGLERPGWLRKALRYLRKWRGPEQKNFGPPIADLMVMLKQSLAEFDQKHSARPFLRHS